MRRLQRPERERETIVLPYLRPVAIGYALVLILVPIGAVVASLCNPATGITEYIAWEFIIVGRLIDRVCKYMPGDFLLAAVAMLYHKKKVKVSLALVVASGLLLVLGMYSHRSTMTLVVNFGVRSIPGQTVECIYTAFVLSVMLTAIFLPSIVSNHRKKKHLLRTVLVNVAVGWIGPLWIILMFLAFKDDKETKKEAAQAQSDDAPPAVSSDTEKAAPKLHQRELKKRNKRKR